MPDTAATPDNSPIPPSVAAPQDDWAATAQPDAAAQAPAADTPPAIAPNLMNPPPDISKMQAADAPAPVVTSTKPGGIAGLVQDIADLFAGKTRPEIGTDQQGNKYVKTTSLTRGQQWEKIAGEALTGAAKGLAAGRGRGNLGAAAAAGVDAGQQMNQQADQKQKDMTAEARQQNLDNANNQMLRMNMAEQSMKMAAMKTQATQNGIKFADDQTDRLLKEGGTVLGTMAKPDDLRNILKVNPDVMQDMIQKHQIEIMPHYNPDGTPGGFKVIKMPDGYRTNLIPDGAEFKTFDETTGQYQTHKVSGPITQGEIDDYNHAAGVAGLKWQNDKQEQNLKGAQTAEANAKAANAPAETAELRARTAASYAQANESNAKALTEKEKQSQVNDPALVDEIGSGKMAPERLSYLITRNPDLLQKVAERYPDFDSSKVASYAGVYKEFTSTKPGTAGAALNNGGTALKHLAELSRMNTVASHLPGSPAYNAYQDKAGTVASELAKFYGNTSLPAIAEIKSKLTTNMPGTRQAGITTQAQSMGDKLDSYEQTWRNAAPSSKYEAPMPQIDREAIEARAALDPKFKQRQVQQQAAPAATSPTTHAFSQSAWQATHRGQDVNAAAQAAKAQGYEVIP
jgi:hypothetical protein